MKESSTPNNQNPPARDQIKTIISGLESDSFKNKKSVEVRLEEIKNKAF
jgi:hypothetical protein